MLFAGRIRSTFFPLLKGVPFKSGKKVNLIFKANGTLQLSKKKNYVLTGKKVFFPSTNPQTIIVLASFEQ